MKCEEWAMKREVESWAIKGLKVEKCGGLPQKGNRQWVGGIMGGEASPVANLLLISCAQICQKSAFYFKTNLWV